MHKFVIKRTLITSQVLKKTSSELASDIKSNTKSTTRKQRKYSETVLLPRSQFRAQLNGKERIEKDKYLSEVRHFAIFYYLFLHLLLQLFHYRSVVFLNCMNGKEKISQVLILFYTMDLLMQMESLIWGMLLIRFCSFIIDF